MKTKKSIRYDKNYLSIYRALQRECVNRSANKTSEKKMVVEFAFRVKNARIYLREAMHIHVLGTEITAGKVLFSGNTFLEFYIKVV